MSTLHLELGMSPEPGGLERVLQALRRRQIRLHRFQARREGGAGAEEGYRVHLEVEGKDGDVVKALLARICDVETVEDTKEGTGK